MKKILFIFTCSLLFLGCNNKKQAETIVSNKEVDITAQTDLQTPKSVSESVIEKQIDVEQIVATKESLSNYYVCVGDNKIYVDGMFSIDEGIIYTIKNTKIADKSYKFKTFLFNEETNKNVLLVESNHYGLSEMDSSVAFDGDYLVRFYKESGVKYVDLYNYKTNTYVYTGYDVQYDKEKHLLTIGLSNALSTEDEEKVVADFENYNYGNLPEDYIQYLKKGYVYEINYFTNEINIIKGDYYLELQ